MRCFVDIDGILADQLRHAQRAHGMDPGDYYRDPAQWPGALGDPSPLGLGRLSPQEYARPLRAWLGKYTRRTLLGDCKHACAHKGALLIDDSDEQVERFRQAGGWAILLPRAWNSRHAEAGDPVGALRRDLDRHAHESFHFGR